MFSKVFGSNWCYLIVALVVLSCSFNEINGVLCEHCKKDFKGLGRHVWRCKGKVVIDPQTVTNIPEETEIPARSLERTHYRTNK